MIRQGMASIACNVTWEMLQNPGVSAPQLASLQSEWERCRFTDDMTRAIEMERNLELEEYDRLLASPARLQKFLEQSDQSAELLEQDEERRTDIRGRLRDWVQIPLWKLAWVSQDSLRALASWQSLLEKQRRVAATSWKDLRATGLRGDADWFGALLIPTDQDIPPWWTRFRFLVSGRPSALSEVLCRRTVMADAQARMTVAALAIQRHQLDTGHLPDTLAALVPKYLSAVPKDPMDGGELRYRRVEAKDKATEEYVLYSVGTNSVDDGGDPVQAEESQGHQGGMLREGRDFVWPRADP